MTLPSHECMGRRRHEMNYNKSTTDAQLEKHLGTLAQAEFLAIGGDGTIDERLLSLCPNVKVVSVVGVGLSLSLSPSLPLLSLSVSLALSRSLAC
eukprot:COSAG03_NODE_3025_length_2280_cov_6.983952_3_plen_95_part_00